MTTANAVEKHLPALINELGQIAPLAEMKGLLEAATNDDIDITELAQLIEASPVIAARVVGMANSAFYCLAEPVQSVMDAIVRVLGLNQVRSMVIGIAANASFDPGKCPNFDSERYWSSALLTAYLARELASALKVDNAPTPDEAYLCGVLHNIGVIALTEVAPDAMNNVFAIQNTRPERNLAGIEQEILGINHCHAGSILAADWGLPDEVKAAIEHHPGPDYNGDYWPVSRLIGFCRSWAQQALHGEQHDLYHSGYLNDLGIDQEMLDGISENCIDQVESIIGLAKIMAN